MKIELGLTSFGDNSDIHTEDSVLPRISSGERIRNVIEEIKLADEVGLDVYGLGEHHRADYAVSDPVTVLAAAASQTEHIRLSSAVTVLSSDDPVRVYERFATLDAVSDGRAEIMAGRGSFIESFPLFGYDLNDYDLLYEEKLDLLMNINKNEKVTWSGQTRPAIDNLGIYPRAVQKEIPIYLATGGTPESSARAGFLGLPITYAIIGGNPGRFRYNVEVYKAAAREGGHDVKSLSIANHSWGYIAETDEQAFKEYYPSTKAHHDVLGKERGWGPYSESAYINEIENGALFVGGPERVARKIIKTVEELDLNRFLIHLPVGSMPHDQIMNAIRLYGEKVKPIVDDYFKDK
ncbi:LLM class flavin-dependent oxidoreductase [Macrococcus hajekii]|uniref:LLM class flavin-dependent oxidoreductase n=1 Tax=Macrococcus hajekii TaxID=198482 RepID=A0A4R6BMY8_9STAP|nr:LLM class flavin-dependent oxidoreductase [Macrococcus hajekii]TDM03214.1 LLM class flavin-dependent oxidoreductase [Macrococcus hajekii]GGA96941.1 N5,N10-methylene tetrahydromethanopterin reductase [Macrococcus hajekii]